MRSNPMIPPTMPPIRAALSDGGRVLDVVSAIGIGLVVGGIVVIDVVAMFDVVEDAN
jgi:hypothetical protein